MAQSFDVCIRGSGIVGRTLALLLARERLRVALVEPALPLASEDVRAYALNAASRALLESLRAWPAPEHATPVREMRVQGDQGAEVSFQAENHEQQALAWIVDVPALETLLADAVHFQPLIERVVQLHAAPLTVVCEGRASSTRAAFGVEFSIQPYGQHAIAARLDCELPHGQVARQWFRPDSVLALLPLGGAQGHGVALVWSVAQERAPELLALPVEEFCAQLADASQHALGALQLTSERRSWPLQQARANRWSGRMADGNSWALAGDAAHTVHPLAGQGLNLGLADARELAQVLQGRAHWRSVGDLHLLRRYERARKTGILSMGLASDGLQQLFMRQGAPWQALRNWGLQGFARSGPLKAWAMRQAMGGH
ncbi:MAG TPA: FAD-dependent monooxygenase [Burkholderiaceae bacterium]